MKFSVVMFWPKIASSGSQRRKADAARRARASSASLRRLLPKEPPTLAFDSLRQPAIASTTEAGDCVPPGPSRNAVGTCSAEKRARTASTSSATVVIGRKLPHYDAADEQHPDAAARTARPRRGNRARPPLARDRPERQPQHVPGRRVRALLGAARGGLRPRHAPG